MWATSVLPLCISLLACSFSRVHCEEGVCASGTWESNGITVAGGYGNGSSLNQVNPNYLHVNARDGSLVITDWWFDRVVKWEEGAAVGQVIAGGKGRGNTSEQLGGPVGIQVGSDEALTICDGQNRRVQRWNKGAGRGETLLANTSCRGIAFDDEGSLYVVDWVLFRVMKWKANVGEVIAGGNDQGSNANQLNNPIGLFVDANRTVYVVDRSNHCVSKWEVGAKEGTVVAGGNGQGAGLNQLNSPTGVFVDRMGTVYVTDRLNNRVMKWIQGASSGTVIAGGNGMGTSANQLNGGFDLSFDRHGHLYITDDGNFRVQKFICKGSSSASVRLSSNSTPAISVLLALITFFIPIAGGDHSVIFCF